MQTTSLNKYLSELMENLTAEMLRTYNTSKMFQEQLDELTISEFLVFTSPSSKPFTRLLMFFLSCTEQDPVASKLLAYDKASRSVAAFCNHQV